MKNTTKLGSNRAMLVGQWEEVPPGKLAPAKLRTRSHPKSKKRALRASIEANGIVTPIVVSSAYEIVDGHLRVDIATALKLPTVPIIRVDHMSEADLRALGIACNRMPADVNWDFEALAIEFNTIISEDKTFDLTLTGFSVAATDRILGNHKAGLYDDLDEDEFVEAETATPRARLGDLYELGGHRLKCGDATDPYLVHELMDGHKARACFIDMPFNVKINGHVSGSGAHSEFAMASGEMSTTQFDEFILRSLDNVAASLVGGGVCYACMDHAHLGQLLNAGDRIFEARLNICVWDKGHGGMGSLYRSQHEMVAVFKHGTEPHFNNVSLGKHGRNRTNVWSFPGMAGFGKGRKKALELHPTVKPVALVAEALLDVTAPGDLVIDLFGGSGTTLIAAERIGRVARLVEIDPVYVDRTIARWERMTGQVAQLLYRAEPEPDAPACPDLQANYPTPETA